MDGSTLLRMGLSNHVWRSLLPCYSAGCLLLVAPLLIMIAVGRRHTSISKKLEIFETRNRVSKRYTRREEREGVKGRESRTGDLKKRETESREGERKGEGEEYI